MAQNTTIRIPRVLDVFAIEGTVYIIQERIKWPILEDVWHSLSPEEHHISMVQLKDCLDQLRALKPPHPERVQAIDGSGLIDDRMQRGTIWGPFANHDDFHCQCLNHDVLRAHFELNISSVVRYLGLDAIRFCRVHRDCTATLNENVWTISHLLLAYFLSSFLVHTNPCLSTPCHDYSPSVMICGLSFCIWDGVPASPSVSYLDMIL